MKKIASRPIFAYIPSIANRPKNDPKWVLKHFEPIFFQLMYGFLVSNNHLVPFRGHFSGFSNLKGLNTGAAYSVPPALILSLLLVKTILPRPHPITRVVVKLMFFTARPPTSTSRLLVHVGLIDTVDSIKSFIDGGAHILKVFNPMNLIFCMFLI